LDPPTNPGRFTLELENAAKHGTQHGVKVRKTWDPPDGYGLPVLGHAKNPLAVANGLVGGCSTLVDAGTRRQLESLLTA